MVIKKLAIRNGIRFTRVIFLDGEDSICDQASCIFNSDTVDFKCCNNECPEIYRITGTEETDISFGYVVKEKDRLDI